MLKDREIKEAKEQIMGVRKEMRRKASDMTEGERFVEAEAKIIACEDRIKTIQAEIKQLKR